MGDGIGTVALDMVKPPGMSRGAVAMSIDKSLFVSTGQDNIGTEWVSHWRSILMMDV